MKQEEFLAIVLFKQNHKEHDVIVKLLTLEHGKQMFFVRGFHNGSHVLKPALQPFSIARFIGKINGNGLSFLSEYKALNSLKKAHGDIFIEAYLSYMVNLIDAVIDDRIVHRDIFYLLFDAIKQVEQNKDIEIVTLILELKLLYFFGVSVNLDGCVFTGEKHCQLDFSFKYNGLISSAYYNQDNYRLRANPNAIYLLQKLNQVKLSQLGQVKISAKMKQELRQIVDSIYHEYVNIQLKSKKFIDELNQWHTHIPDKYKIQRGSQ